MHQINKRKSAWPVKDQLWEIIENAVDLSIIGSSRLGERRKTNYLSSENQFAFRAAYDPFNIIEDQNKRSLKN